MKQLKRNKRKFYYANYVSDADLQDTYTDGSTSYDLYTGEQQVYYTQPKEVWGNISVPTGFANVERFGSIISYDLNITLEDPDTEIDERTVLWVDKDPFDSDRNVTPFNFLVRRVARSLNSSTLQCAQAEVQGNVPIYIEG